jgi:hypothetical protein
MMSGNLMHGRERSAGAPIGSVDETPVRYLHMKETPPISSLTLGADSFTITRLESSSGLTHPITKVTTVPALLVAVSITPVARADYEFCVDDKRVPTPYIQAFRSTVVDLDARPSCWIRRTFGYMLFHCLAEAWTRSRPIFGSAP